MLNLEKIHKAYNLICEIYGETEVDVKILSKELKVSMTRLVDYIKENIKHFDIDYKNITKKGFKYLYFQGRKVKMPDEIVVGKILYVYGVYMNVEDNPKTDEWLQKKIKEYENIIYLERVVFWSTTPDWYIPVDEYDKNDKYRKYLWRNTIEKINKIKNIVGAVKEKTYACLDSSKTVDTYIDEEGIKKLKEKGWKIIKVEK
jgi:hypothetical protein